MLKLLSALTVLALTLVFKNSSAAPRFFANESSILNIDVTLLPSTITTISPNFTTTLNPNITSTTTWYPNITTFPPDTISPNYTTTLNPNITSTTTWYPNTTITWNPNITDTTTTSPNVTIPVPPEGSSYFEETRRVVKTYFEEVVRRIWRSGSNAIVQVDKNITQFP